MDLNALIELLNQDLRREYQHMLFYAHSANMLVGLERLYLADKLKEHAASEMQHVFQFAEKIRANKGSLKSGLDAVAFPTDIQTAKDILTAAIQLEEEVVRNYHDRHDQASQLYDKTGMHYDLVIFLEEQIEHSQADIDELKLIVAGM